jgi:uncharacterized protein YegL
MGGPTLESLKEGVSLVCKYVASAFSPQTSVMTYKRAPQVCSRREPLATIQIPPLTATGTSGLGKALQQALLWAEEDIKSAHPPEAILCVIFTDGSGTDDWIGAMETLRERQSANHMLLVGVACGYAANLTPLVPYLDEHLSMAEGASINKLRRFVQNLRGSTLG